MDAAGDDAPTDEGVGRLGPGRRSEWPGRTLGGRATEARKRFGVTRVAFGRRLVAGVRHLFLDEQELDRHVRQPGWRCRVAVPPLLGCHLDRRRERLRVRNGAQVGAQPLPAHGQIRAVHPRAGSAMENRAGNISHHKRLPRSRCAFTVGVRVRRLSDRSDGVNARCARPLSRGMVTPVLGRKDRR